MEEIRYAVMRLVRFVVMLATELAMVITLAYGVVFTILGIFVVLGDRYETGMNWVVPFTGVGVDIPAYVFNYSPLTAMAFLVTAAVMFMLMLACGTPYRYKTSMPGITAYKCPSCGLMGRDTIRCAVTKCGSIRLDRIVAWAGVGLSLVVTVGFVTHDVATFGLWYITGRMK